MKLAGVGKKRGDPSVRYVAASLILGVFFGGLGGGVAFPTIPRLGPILGISPFLVGVILSMNRFTRLVCNTPAGSVLDRIGTRRPMIVGFVLQGLAPFGYVLGLHAESFGASSASVFLAARALWGIGSALVFVGAFATITHVTTPENRGRWVGYMRGGQSLGFPGGLVLGGLLADTYGFTVAFVAAGCAGLFAASVAALVLPDLEPDVDRTGTLREIPSVVRRDPRIASVGAVNFLVRFLFVGVLLSTIVLYAARKDIAIGALSETGVSGVVMALAVVCTSLTTVLVGRYSDRLSNRALIAVPALGVLGAGFLALAFVPTLAGALGGVALIGVGVGGTNPPLLAYLGDISPGGDVGKLGGVYNTFGDLGSTLGPLVALPLVAEIGFTVEYLACALLVVGAGALVIGTLLGEDPTIEPRSRPTGANDGRATRSRIGVDRADEDNEPADSTRRSDEPRERRGPPSNSPRHTDRRRFVVPVVDIAGHDRRPSVGSHPVVPRPIAEAGRFYEEVTIVFAH